MTYKKYIWRDGKRYGPYLYSSRRVDGKVVTEYQGPKDAPLRSVESAKHSMQNRMWILIMFGGIFLAATLLLLVRPALTGFVTFNSEEIPDRIIVSNDSLTFTLLGGELLPKDTLVTITQGETVISKPLSELLPTRTLSGSWYLSGAEISGTGEGFGVMGEKEIAPEVSFKLKIIESQKNNSSVSESNTSAESESVGGSSETSESPQETSSSEGESGGVEVISPEESSTNPIDTSVEVAPSSEESSSGPSDTLSAVSPETTESSSDSETSSESSGDSESSSESSSDSGSSIASAIAQVFRPLTLTGFSIAETTTQEIEGSTKKDRSFTYAIPEGSSVELVSGSVFVDDISLPDSTVDISVLDSELIVTTEYTATDEGFGETYLHDNYLSFTIVPTQFNLSSFSSVNVSFEYDGALLFSSENAAIVIPNTSLIEPVFNETMLNETNQTLVNTTTVSFALNISLTESERAILIDSLGNSSITTTAEEIRDRIIVRYTLGDYWSEFSYDASINPSQLKSYMEYDRISWLKDLAAVLSQKSTVPINRSDLSGSYVV